jgi:hypothetical protein
MADEEEDSRPVAYDDDETESGMFRWMSALVVLLAVAGFFGLAWYAYKSGGEAVDEKDVEIVKADKTPIKEAPANPGGMQIPNQDKTVYGLISGKTEKPVVERILPAPEEPLQRGDTETWMSDSVKNKGDDIDGETDVAKPESPVREDALSPAAPGKEQFNPAKALAAHAGEKPVMATAAPVTPVTTTDKAAPPAASKQVAAVAGTASSTPLANAAAPAPGQKTAQAEPQHHADDSDTEDADDDIKLQMKPIDKPAEKPAAKPVEKLVNKPQEKVAEKPAPKKTTKVETKIKTPPAALPSGARVQLGAYKSQSEAEKNWSRISGKFAEDLSGKKHYIVRVDLGKKGVYYRLQLAPFSSARDAESFCLDIVSGGQGCILAKGK